MRTAWLYDRHGGGFVGTKLKLARRQRTVSVVCDQRGQPTFSYQLAERVVELGCRAPAGNAPPGIYHGTCAGQTSWFGLARAVFELAGLGPERVQPVISWALPSRVIRPAFTVLGHSRWSAAGPAPLPHWRDALAAALRIQGSPDG